MSKVVVLLSELLAFYLVASCISASASADNNPSTVISITTKVPISLPPSGDTTKPKNISDTPSPEIQPALRFPNASATNVKFMENDTIREQLAKHATELTDTEVNDLNKPVHTHPVSATKSAQTSTKPSTTVHKKHPPGFKPTSPVNRKMDTEYIENGKNTEDKLREEHKNSTGKAVEEVKQSGMPGQLVGILAGTIVIMSVLVYIGLMSWRRYLERRYGSRQMLVNDEDEFDDLRNFSI